MTDSIIKHWIENKGEELTIPAYLDADYVKETLEDGIIIWQEDNENNYTACVIWLNNDHPIDSMVYFSRFFKIGTKTVVSHDVSTSNLLEALTKFSEKLNYFLQK